jgi:hypothetical protein
VLGVAPLDAQQRASAHHWTTVVARQDVRIELDANAVRASDHQRHVSLRWTFPTAVAHYASVELEERDVDCARGDTRLLAGSEVTIDNGTSSAPAALAVSGADSIWHQPSRGSLVAEAVQAVCRR